ncbi:MAG: alpha/beta hydrolase [Dokdonella sp.]
MNAIFTALSRSYARLALLLSVVAVAGCSSILFTGLNALSPDGELVEARGITFDRSLDLKLDIYRPKNASNAPVVVFYYGGRWEFGKRADYRWFGEALARNGFVAILPDYRKYPQVKFDGFMTDAANALAWSFQHAAEYGGDSDQLFVMGHSAGAHLALMLATNAQWMAPHQIATTRLAGAVGLAGPYNFLPLKEDDLIDMFGRTPDEQARTQPINFVDGDEPPMLLLHGSADSTVWPKNSTTLAQAVNAKGGRAEIIMYPDVTHSGILLSVSPTFRGKASALEDSVKFINKVVAQRKAAPLK